MSERSHPIEISIWDIPSVRYNGETYRVFNSKHMKPGGDYIITGVDSEDYIDIVEEIHWDALYIRGVSNIIDIEGLSALTFLKRLDIFCGTISKIVGLDTLVNLEDLDLSNNQIKSTSGLQTLINLKKLRLNDNHISKVEGLIDLRNLKELYLYNNQIRELDCSELPIGLEVLYIKRNHGIKLKNFDRLWHMKEFSD